MEDWKKEVKWSGERVSWLEEAEEIVEGRRGDTHM